MSATVAAGRRLRAGRAAAGTPARVLTAVTAVRGLRTVGHRERSGSQAGAAPGSRTVGARAWVSRGGRIPAQGLGPWPAAAGARGAPGRRAAVGLGSHGRRQCGRLAAATGRPTPGIAPHAAAPTVGGSPWSAAWLRGLRAGVLARQLRPGPRRRRPPAVVQPPGGSHGYRTPADARPPRGSVRGRAAADADLSRRSAVVDGRAPPRADRSRPGWGMAGLRQQPTQGSPRSGRRSTRPTSSVRGVGVRATSRRLVGIDGVVRRLRWTGP
jgi:hypothetical protein